MTEWDEAEPVLGKIADAYAASGADGKKAIAAPAAGAALLAPILYPGVIFLSGSNYADHAKEMSGPNTGVDKTKTEPFMLLKSAIHAVIGPGAEIRLPAVSAQVDWEAELAAVIGRPTRNISVADALDCVAGYTILNDLSARDLGKREDWPRFGQDWLSHKTFETSAPMGPWITPAAQIGNPHGLAIALWVNDEQMQDSNTSQMIFDTAEQIAYLSRRVTLRPGDVISTGTPSGVGRPRGIFLKPGDRVRIEIEGIGTLENPVVQGE